MAANANGSIAQQLAYDEYGNLTSQAPAADTGEPFRYMGRRFDRETGLYYFRARYYSPQLGRFLQTDPVGYEDDVNLYGFLGNDPLNYVDPSGEVAIAISVGIGVVVIGVACKVSGACDRLAEAIWPLIEPLTEPAVRSAMMNENGGDDGQPRNKPTASPVASNNDTPQDAENSLTGLQDKAKKDKKGRSIKDADSEFEGARKRPEQNHITQTGRSNQRASTARTRGQGDTREDEDPPEPPEDPPDPPIPPELRDKYIINR